MEIKWFGHACFQIKAKEGTIVTDPYSQEVGWSLPPLQADVLTISHDHFDHNAKDLITAKKVFDAPGEYEAIGMSILGVMADHDASGGSERGKVTMFKFHAEGINLLHVGDLGTQLSEGQIDEIGAVDVLMVPVGGVYTLDAEGATRLISQLEPKIIIPMHYNLPGLKVDIQGLDKFLSEIGLNPHHHNSLTVTRKSLPAEGEQLVVLEKVS